MCAAHSSSTENAVAARPPLRLSFCRYHLEWANGSLNPEDWPARGLPPNDSLPHPRTTQARAAGLRQSMRAAAQPPTDSLPLSRCIYVVRGKRCRRKATADGELCPYHLAWAMGPDADDLWAKRVHRDARRLLSEAQRSEGIDDEVAMIRLIIWRNLEEGRNEELARRGIETLIRALKLQADLRQTDNSLDTVFERVLDTLEEEFPILKTGP